MALLLGGCYHSVAPSVGYTLDHGFTYGVSYSGDYGFAGANTGFVRRPTEDGSTGQNVGYATAALSTLGVVEAGAGVGFVSGEDVSFAAILGGSPIKPIRLNEDSSSLRFSPMLGIRYLGGAFEFYVSPRLYIVGTGGRH